jgi:hypothetical protein
MAALTAAVVPAPYYDPAFPIGERYYASSAAADVFYRGAIVCADAGLVVADNADADTCLGVCTKGTTVTGAAEPVAVATHGVWWFAAVAFTTALQWTLFGPLATSDNPADMVSLAGGNPSCLGTLVHCDVTTVSGWIDLAQRVVPANT